MRYDDWAYDDWAYDVWSHWRDKSCPNCDASGSFDPAPYRTGLEIRCEQCGWTHPEEPQEDLCIANPRRL